MKSNTRTLPLHLNVGDLKLSRLSQDLLDESSILIDSFRPLHPTLKPVFEPMVGRIRGLIDLHHRARYFKRASGDERHPHTFAGEALQ